MLSQIRAVSAGPLAIGVANEGAGKRRRVAERILLVAATLLTGINSK